MRRRIQRTSEELSELLSRPTLTVPEGAAVLGLGTTAFRACLQRGEIDLPVISVGTRKVIPVSAIKRLLGAEQ